MKSYSVVEIVRLSVKDLVCDRGLESMPLSSSLIKANLGTQQVSLVHVAADDPKIVVAGYEAMIAATAKGARWVWGLCWRQLDLLEPAASRDPDLLRHIPALELIWR